jgi:hypothetical protein
MPDAPACDDLPPALPIEQITLIDPRSAETRREYQVGVPRAMSANRPPVIIRERPWQDDLVGILDSLSPTVARETAVVVADGFSEPGMQAASRVARLHSGTPVYMRAPSGEGISEPIFDQLRLYRLDLLVGGGVPEDTWTRVARHWHECHRRENPVPQGHPKARSRVPWGELDQFVRQDNILQVRSILLAVATLGREWTPVRMLLPGSFIELSDRELEAVAEIEHTRWFRRQVAFSRAGNELAVPWPDLTPERQLAEREQVRTQVSQLEEAGFLPIVRQGGPPEATDFVRAGIVSATQLTSPLRWTIHSGEQLRGNAGDWRVDSGRDEVRTVTDPEFQASHEPVGNGQWRRVGTFRAWQVTEPVQLRTKEGRATAGPGDWVVESPAGERWPVSEQQFERTYRPVRDAPGANHRPG